MARPVTPLWLAAPSRFAHATRGRARVVLAGLALLVAASFLALGVATVGDAPADRTQTDLVLYQTIVEGIRAGGDYYGVAARSLRAGGYPLRPFVTFRLPALAVIQAALPHGAVVILLDGLALGVFAAWWLRLRAAFARRLPLAVALVLLAGGMAAFVQGDLAAFQEVWAGLLIALSLALRRPERWIEAVAFGMMAMLIRETAALYVAVMAVLAFTQGSRREATGWAVTLGVLAVVVALHAHAVSQVVHATDAASPGWGAMLGFGYFAEAMAGMTALTLLPMLVAAPLVALAMAGWSAWNSELGLRVLATLAAYAMLIALFARAETFYWGLMIAPTLLVGLAFLPDGLRDLVRAAAPAC
jgi:hypothetical protein